LAKKRVLVLSDMHCGHFVGLTHPSDNPKYDDPYLKEASVYREFLWDWFIGKVRALKKIDVLVHNGDAIDGKGKASGGTEQIEMDRNLQAKMAANILSRINTKEIRLVYGTGYHTGKLEDFEDVVAAMVGCPKPSGELNIDVNGVILNFKHKAGGSSIPHGRMTAQLRDKMWNTLWAARGEYPESDIQIRSHNHYFKFGGDADSFLVATPALQGYGWNKYGTRIMSGTVDYGFCWFDVYDNGEHSFQWEILRMPYQAPEKL
jgi:hypothetical protein